MIIKLKMKIIKVQEISKKLKIWVKVFKNLLNKGDKKENSLLIKQKEKNRLDKII